MARQGPRDDSLAALPEASRDFNATGSSYLREEIKAARLALGELERQAGKAESFKEISLQMSEEAARALSRLEQAAATREAPELIVVACEIKVAARRGVLLIKSYGRYRFLGKVVALAMRPSVHERYNRVIMQLTALLPSGGPPGAAGSAELDSSMLNARALANAGSMMSAMSTSNLGPPPSPLSQASPQQQHSPQQPQHSPQQQHQQPQLLSPGHSQSHLVVSGSQHGGSAAAYTGHLIRPGKHDRVYSISFVPGVSGWPAHTCFWWAVGDGIEFYSDSTQCTTSFPIEKERNNMLSIAIDSRGNVWGGTVKGYLRVRKKKSWDMVVEDRVLSAAVRTIALDGDEEGVAWVGDDAGHVRVVRYDEAAQKLEMIGAPAVPFGSPVRELSENPGGLGRRATGLRSVSGKRDEGDGSRNGTLRRRGMFRSPCGYAEDKHLEGPVRAALVRDGRAWVAGGRSDAWIALFDSDTCAHVDSVRCGSVGSCHAMCVLSWDGRRPSPASPPTALAAFRRTGSSSELGGVARVEVLVEESDPRAAWQLLTGHDSGLLLVWQASADVLQPVMKIGDTTSAIRGIAVFDALDLVCTAHANGELSLFVRPCEDMEWGLAPRSTPSQAVSVLRPRRVAIRAHRSPITCAVAQGECMATASALGTIRSWHVHELAREAERQGLMLGGLLRSPADTIDHRRSSFNSQSKSLNSFSRARTTSSIPSDLGKVSYNSASHQQQQQQQQSQPPLLHHGRSSSGGMGESHALGLGSFPMASGPHGTFTMVSTPLSPISSGPGNSPSAAAAAANASAGPFAQHAGSSMLLVPAPTTASSGSVLLAAPNTTAAAVTAAQDTRDSGSYLIHSAGAFAAPATAGSGTSSGSFAVPYAAAGNAAVSHALSGAMSGYGSGYVSSSALNVIGEGPRAPLAARQPVGTTRERRKSQRRLSRASQMNFGNCQVIESTELKLLNHIGSGAYGKVWLADWGGTQVAAKELVSFQAVARDKVVRKHKRRSPVPGQDGDESNSSDDGNESDDSVDSVDEEVTAELKELMNEVYLLGTLSHPNIMRFCAVVLDPPMIVTQYYAHGSLFDLLKKARRGEKRAVHELSWTKRLDMLRDVAAGMVFLHSRRPAPVIHGDLRSPNLLLDLSFDKDRPRFHVKIADFGLARMLGPGQSLAVSKVTNPRWSAPEVISRSEVSKSADVFSFGVVMWEMLTWQQPYEEMMSVQVLFSVMQNCRPELPPDNELPGRPGASLPMFKQLMESSWSGDPAERPSFEFIVAKLDEMRAMDAAMRRGESNKSLQRSSRRLSGDSETAPATPRSAPTSGASTFSEADAAALYAAAVLGGHLPGGVAALHGGAVHGLHGGSGGDSTTSITDPAAMLAAAAAAAGGGMSARPDVRAQARSDPGYSPSPGDDSGGAGGALPPARLLLSRLGSQPEYGGYTSASSQGSGASGISSSTGQPYGTQLGVRSSSGPNRHVGFNLHPQTSIGAASSLTGGASTPNSPGSPVGHGELSFATGLQPWAQQQLHEAVDAAEALAAQQQQQQQPHFPQPAMAHAGSAGVLGGGVQLPVGVERSVANRISGNGGFVMSRLGPGGTRSSGSLYAGRSDASDAIPSPRFGGVSYGSPGSPSVVGFGNRYAAASPLAAAAPAGGPFAQASHGSSYGGSSSTQQWATANSDSASSSPFAASSQQAQQQQQQLPPPAMQLHHRRSGSTGSALHGSQPLPPLPPHAAHGAAAGSPAWVPGMQRAGSDGSSSAQQQPLAVTHPPVQQQQQQQGQGQQVGSGSPFAPAQPSQQMQQMPGAPVAAVQRQASGNPSVGSQQLVQAQQASSSPFAAAQAAKPHSPFAAAQVPASPFAAAQQPAASASSAASTVATAAARQSSAAAQQPGSPFAAVQQAATAAKSPFAAAQVPPAAASASSPFAAAQQPSGAPQQPAGAAQHSAGQRRSSSPFAAAQEPPAAASSPFAAAQQARPRSPQPAEQQQQQQQQQQGAGAAQSYSPFAAAQQLPPFRSRSTTPDARPPSGDLPQQLPPPLPPQPPQQQQQRQASAARSASPPPFTSPFAVVQSASLHCSGSLRPPSPPLAPPKPASPFATMAHQDLERILSGAPSAAASGNGVSGGASGGVLSGSSAAHSGSSAPRVHSPFSRYASAAESFASGDNAGASRAGSRGASAPGSARVSDSGVALQLQEAQPQHGPQQQGQQGWLMAPVGGASAGPGSRRGSDSATGPAAVQGQQGRVQQGQVQGEWQMAPSTGMAGAGSRQLSGSGTGTAPAEAQQQQQQQQQDEQQGQWWLGAVGGVGSAVAPAAALSSERRPTQEQNSSAPATATSPRSRLTQLQASFPDAAVAAGGGLGSPGSKIYKPLNSFVISIDDPSLAALRQGLPATDSLTFPVPSGLRWEEQRSPTAIEHYP